MAKKIQKFILLFLFCNLFLAQVNLASAADTYNYANAGVSSQIEQYLCAPPKTSTNTAAQNNNASGALYNCINRLYKFSIALAAVIAVFFIVIAGYLYMSAEGNQESVDKAKSILVSSITSLVILFAGYILLKAINPDLVQFQNIQPPSVVITPEAGPPGGLPTAEAKSTAQQILDLHNSNQIILADSHQSRVSDNATALKNIRDTAAGNAATRSDYEGAPGLTVALNPNMLKALLAIGKQYKINVSEIAGGSHPAEKTNPISPLGHYGGNAFDITDVNGERLAPGGRYVKVLMDLCVSLGATPSQVIDETATASHVHCGGFPVVSTPGPTGPGIIAGYDITSYATAPGHEEAVATQYRWFSNRDFSSARSIDQIFKSLAASTPLTGDMVLSSARKYNVDARLIAALMQIDSNLGSQGLGAVTHNPGNVGNDDSGKTKDWGTWPAGVDAVAEWLSRHRV